MEVVSLLLIFALFLFHLCLKKDYIHIEVKAENFGNFDISWAQRYGKNYSNENATRFLINTTNTRYTNSVSAFKLPARYRIKPDYRHASTFLTRLKIRRLGLTQVDYAGGELASIKSAGGVELSRDDSRGLLFARSGEHPQAELIVGRFQNIKILIIFGLVILFSIGGLLLLYRLAAAYAPLPRLFSFLLLIVLLWSVVRPGSIPNLHLFAAAPASLVAAVLSVVACKRLFVTVVEFLSPRRLIHLSFVVIVLGALMWLGLPKIPLYDYHYDQALSQSREQEQVDGLLQAFPKKFESSFRQHFEEKRWLTYFNSFVRIFAFNHSPTPKAILGEQGYFFEGHGERKVEKGIVKSFDNVSDYMGQLPFSETQLNQWLLALEERQCWLRQRDIDYLFVLAPTKGLVYPELLPAQIRNARDATARPSRYHQLIAHLRRYSTVPVVDLKQPMLVAKEKTDDPKLFYRTDFHWNFYGAYFAYKSMIQGVKEYFPHYGVQPAPLEDFEIDIDRNWVHVRFLGLIGLIPELHRDEHYIKLKPHTQNVLSKVSYVPEDGVYDIRFPYEKYENTKGEELEIATLENPYGEIPSMLILGDSFIEKTILYLSAHAKKTLFQRAVFHFPVKLFEFQKPDLVIQEILNMFILQDPPLNPPQVKAAYVDNQCVR